VTSPGLARSAGPPVPAGWSTAFAALRLPPTAGVLVVPVPMSKIRCQALPDEGLTHAEIVKSCSAPNMPVGI